MGGIQNVLKQHNPGVSKICRLNLEKKNKAITHQKSQPGLLHFFKKEPSVVVPPTVPNLAPVIAYAMESVSQLSGTHKTGVMPRTASTARNTHTVNILVTLEEAVESLPALPDAGESDEIAAFSENVPTDLAKEEAWEYLDPMLNRFLGFNRTAGSIYNELRGGAKGLSGMVRYLNDFVGRYEIDGALLEGKIQRLVNVIQTWCVAMNRSNILTFDLYWPCSVVAAQARTSPMLLSSQMMTICNMRRRNQ